MDTKIRIGIVAYLHIKQTLSNISIHVESCLWLVIVSPKATLLLALFWHHLLREVSGSSANKCYPMFANFGIWC